MRNILFVETPLHFLNAMEAISYFNLENYTIFIRYSGHEGNDTQLNKLIEKFSTEIEKEYIYTTTIKGEKKQIKDYLKILYYKIYFKLMRDKYKNIFIGDYSSGFLSMLIKNFNKDKIILLDDGAKTISIQNNFDDENYYDLFTMYTLEPKIGQNIYENHFLRLQKRRKDDLTYDEDTIMFLGAKLNEEGIITQEYYLELMDKIAFRYSDFKILYVPHRGDSKEKIAKIAKIKNISILNYQHPIEFYGIYEKSIPRKVFSFYSTALWSMSKMYKEVSVTAFKFDYKGSKHQENIDKVYDYYSGYMKIEPLTSKGGLSDE